MSGGLPTVGFVGIGVMGRGMVLNLLKAGYSVRVYSRRQETAQEVVAAGAVWSESIQSVCRDAQVVITMVGYPSDVEEVYFGDGGLLASCARGTTLIDMTTSSPLLAQRIAAAAKDQGMEALDAPVSGGDVGAREGRLSIMVGGEKSAFDRVLPVFEAMGKNIVWQGPAGSGQFTKMCNQIVIASNMMGICECLVYAKQAGLDEATVLQSIEHGAAGSWGLSNLGPRILRGDFAPGFFVKHFIKDMAIALESAQTMGLELPGLRLAKQLYDQLAQMGESESGTQALYKLIARGIEA